MQFLLQYRLKKNLILSITALIANISFAKELRLSQRINWVESSNVRMEEQVFPLYVSFDKAVIGKQTNYLPKFSSYTLPSRAGVIQSVRLERVVLGVFTNVGSIQNQGALQQSSNYGLNWTAIKDRGFAAVQYSFTPLVLVDGKVQPIVSFDIVIDYEEVAPTGLAKRAFASTSVLAQGTWVKLAVTRTGFHKIDRNLLNSMGFNLSGVDPRTIKLYGYGPGILPQPVSATRPDDLLENAILVQGENDGSFDGGDYILFYGKAQQDVWKRNGNAIEREKNIYSDTTYYYLTISSGNGLRINKQTSQPAVVNTQNQHIYCFAHEVEQTNVGRTGRQFLGEAFDRVPSQTFGFYIDGFQSTEAIKIRSAVAAKSYISPARFDVSANGNLVFSHANIPTVGTSYESPYFSNSGPVTYSFNSTTPQVNINYTYNSPPGGAVGWLDYFEINTNAAMTWYASQVLYRVLPPANSGATAYTISTNANGTRVFNVTSPAQIEELIVDVQTNQASFIYNTTSYAEFAGINSSTSYWVPQVVGRVGNQNLHGLASADAVYITPQVFYQEAVRLAAFHQAKGLNIHVVKLDDIYNEFSSGAQDITAIREFIRMLYQKGLSSTVKLKYVTFFGRASYDYKSRISNNSNFVPTYQSGFSASPIGSYCSDDYFGFLDDGEGLWETGGDLKEGLDVGIGRLPISSASEAAIAVDKIINYHQADRMADWRNKIVFVADDEDNRTHEEDANVMATSVSNRFPNYNIEKIWIDAYKQEVVAGGQRYPTAQKAISDAVQKGCFVVNYTGHGGELGWAAERILTIEDINSWTNEKKLPLFVTATCEFSRFDDPGRVSAGELVFLNNKGGAIALFTTVRLVQAFSNTILNTFLYNRIGLDSTSKIAPKTLGEIIRLTKNDYTSNDRNERNFALLGDAVMQLAYPKYNVVTSSINNKTLTDVADTLKALSKVTITGAVQDMNGQVLNTYQGEVSVTVYDKPTLYQTLVNDATSAPAMDFTMQNNIIYSGSASVTNGLFSFTFVVPKDISYQIGRGKISYYATNQLNDANGNEQRFLVGGTADSVQADGNGPEVKLFMDDYKFVHGGLTNESPLFIAQLFDVSGINTIGRGIGRELMLTIDGDNTKSVPVNEYYKARTNSYQDGEVRYPLKNLSVGKHTASLKAWDTYNNSTETTIEFVVASSEDFALKHVLNYPNPFSTSTVFHFDHNRVGEDLTVMIQIYTVGGRLAKTLTTKVTPATSHFDQLTWNGADEYGDKLANGVYIYKVKVQSQSGKVVEATQKLVILN